MRLKSEILKLRFERIHGIGQHITTNVPDITPTQTPNVPNVKKPSILPIKPEYIISFDNIKTIEPTNKIDLKDITFIIPVMIDSTDRLQNLNLCIKYLTTNFDTNIIVGEESLSRKIKHLDNIVDYIYVKPIINVFYRTKLLNIMAKKVKTPFLCNYDCDIFLFIRHYVETMKMLRSGEYDMVYPHYGNTLVPRTCYNEINEKMDMEKVNIDSSWVYKTISFGCCNMISTDCYMKSGMENENFRSWGPEDSERYERINKLGYKIGRINESLTYHLTHYKGKNSSKSNPYYQQNVKEFEKIKELSRDKLIKYIKTWKWTK